MGGIYNISGSLSFLNSLAAGVMARFPRLEEVTIYLPNKRAIATLSEEFLKISGASAMLLPNMQAVGDVDDDELELNPKYESLGNIKPAISKQKRLLEMAKLLQGSGKERNIVQSMLLAKSLLELVDEVQNKDLNFDVFENIIPEELAQHWQITLDFLKIAGVIWREDLQAKNLAEPIERRNAILNALADFYRNNPPTKPVIIAGSTGSVTATANLIKAIYSAQNGHVVLYGLDEDLSADDHAQLVQTHPQKLLANLLWFLGATEPKNWQNAPQTARQKLISAALLPTHKISAWQNLRLENDIEAIEAENIECEAFAVACALRAALQEPEKTAMVVTTNRALARRIAAKMQIWGVDVNDSAGQPLLTTVSANFLMLMANMFASKFAAIELLSFFKHPFITPEVKAQIRTYERKNLHQPCLEELPPLPFEFAADELKNLFAQKEVGLLNLMQAHISFAHAIAPNLWEREGEELKLFFDNLLPEIEGNFNIDPVLYPAFLGQMLLTKTFRPKYGQHPRISILSPIEARLQMADLVVICGMNEGSFPNLPPADSFMNQNIRRQAGLDLLEKRIGQAAHDFELLANAPKLIISRSKKDGGAPAQKSRFWQRLEAISTFQSGQKYIDWANALVAPASIKPTPRPAPTPPAAARPTALAATKIGKLMRDPYIIYAEKILSLRKLDDIDRELTPADFGNFVHDALEEFAKNYDGNLQTLLEIGQKSFVKYSNYVGAKTFWWNKFVKIAAKFVELEQERRTNQKILLEEKREIKIGGFTLSATADRVEVADGITIIDYKTGALPTAANIKRGLEPQMPIEALIFENALGLKTTAMQFWHLTGTDEIIDIVDIDLAQIELAKANLPAILAKMQDPATPFVARPWSYYAMKYNDYEHLARIKEWAE